MSQILLRGKLFETCGELPKVGLKAPDFELTGTDLSTKSLSDFAGTKIVLNIFPSIDTGTCAQSVRTFNKEASSLINTKVLCISRDLPFAQTRFCAAEGLDKVMNLSDYKNGSFGKTYGLTFVNGPFEALHSRCVVVIDENGIIIHTEQTPSISDEPNYQDALKALINA